MNGKAGQSQAILIGEIFMGILKRNSQAIVDFVKQHAEVKWIIFVPRVASRNWCMSGRTGYFPVMTATIGKVKNGRMADTLTHALGFDLHDLKSFSSLT